MSVSKRPASPSTATASALDLQVTDLMAMVAHLSPRDIVALAGIMRRTAEISETEGEDVAIAVLDQIQAILMGRNLDA